MTTAVCPECGAELTDTKVCAACLLETGLRPLDDDDGDLREFGDYEIVEELGRGGQGVVYRARQRSLNRTVALKVIGLGHWSSTPHLKRFRHEAEAAARLEHAQIVPIYEIGEHDGSCYFSMKFIEGAQLDTVLRREPMTLRRAAELLVKIARTVQFAHERGILHRDIKPGNILLDQNGEPHLTDFGLARLIEQESTITNSFEVMGTPSYMAPEQAAGRVKEMTAAADVYSLGAVFYQMLTRQPPFAGGTTYETIRLVLECDPRDPRLWNPNVDADLATIALKCLEKDPAKRYPTAAALADDVERWLRHEPIHARSIGIFARSKKFAQRNPTALALAASLIALAALASLFVWNAREKPNEGLAVLPFENLSGDTQNASFADGVQDDILTKLAKVAALRVISRTSVMQYRGAQNLAQIADALRVSYVLAGSVQRSASHVRVNAQLINARDDRHVWAETFDRDVIDTFAVQSEIAQKVAELLRVKVTSTEKQSLQRAPTADLSAFDLYTRGRNIFLRTSFSNTSKEDLVEAANLLQQAVERDPSFFQAYCQLVWVHDYLYIVGHDHTSSRLALAETALQSALRLQPEAGEAHLARAENLYRGKLDYVGALAELDRAARSLPNESRIDELRGYILRRQGKHEAAVRSLERASDLDPRNLFVRQQTANSYILLQRFAEAKATLDRELALEPNDPETRAAIAWIDLEWKGDTQPLHREIDAMRAANSLPISKLADAMLICALMERHIAAAHEALAASDQNTALNDQALHFSRVFVEGLIARMANDEKKAQAAFTAARAEQEQVVHAQPDFAPPLCVLGLIDAMLGNKDDSLREGRRALELAPVEKDALNGPLAEKYLALIAAWNGDKELACEQLEAALRDHSTISYGYLKLYPLWDPLRGHPRFEKIVASLGPR